jgi:hypothetical protein
MSKVLPLVRFPAQTAVYRFGAKSSLRSEAILRFDKGLTIPREGRHGWAIVGDSEGRRLAVEVGVFTSEDEVFKLIHRPY